MAKIKEHIDFLKKIPIVGEIQNQLYHLKIKLNKYLNEKALPEHKCFKKQEMKEDDADDLIRLIEYELVNEKWLVFLNLDILN